MNSTPDHNREQVRQALARAAAMLLDSRVPAGHWEGELSSSALSTATAVLALAVVLREGGRKLDRALLDTCRRLADRGANWLAESQNADGGFGDTVGSPGNLSTTVLVWAALTATESSSDQSLSATRAWITNNAGSLDGDALAAAISDRYGKDRTFSAPILTACTLAGAVGSDAGAWTRVPQLPFELAVCPPQWFKWLRLPVVSYALPALIAIGQVRHRFRPTRNPLLRLIRSLARPRSLELLRKIQPASGGYLEAVPLTSFVIMSLAASGQVGHPVVSRSLDFLAGTARSDGAWPIDTNLATWVTTQSLAALAAGENLESHLGMDQREKLRRWLLDQQYRSLHPYTHADPGGWAWTDLPGGVPDADDTAGALLALSHLGSIDAESIQAACAGVQWLLDLQNADGGIPTFCRGWGRLPFDRSSPDLTAHALLAWSSWQGSVPPRLRTGLQSAARRGVDYLAGSQREDGAWVPLWFGNQSAPGQENPTYGTARVVLALNRLVRDGDVPVEGMRGRGIHWLLAVQNADGGWGGAGGVDSTVEETALAVQALADAREAALPTRGLTGTSVEAAVCKGADWLISETRGGSDFKPSPIGLYFSKLWYYERQYPVIFTVAALGRAASTAHRCALS
ncbi:MAG: squalene--hopene cyclase, partial [Acidobacteria bacterium]|nr:squalene--hopene cyclase [Acidobacteriota bacterium]